MSRLLALLHTITILLMMVSIYLWIEVPNLNKFSLQLLCLIVLVYFIVKRINKTNFWQLLPATMSIEVALATAGFLLLVGSTGNLSSIFFPLVFINLFFLVFASHTGTAIFVTGGEILFHLALTSQPSQHEVANLLALPIILIILIFAKNQYQQSTQKDAKLEQEDALMRQEQEEVTVFINTFLRPKLIVLQSLVAKNKLNQSGVEITDIAQELENLEHHLAGYLQEHTEVNTEESETE